MRMRPSTDDPGPAEARSGSLLGRLTRLLAPRAAEDAADGTAGSAAVATTALGLMARWGVPLSPANFTVWHAFAEQKRSDLQEALEARLQDAAPLTPAENVILYERFFGAGQDALTVRRAGGDALRLVEAIEAAARGPATDQDRPEAAEIGPLAKALQVEVATMRGLVERLELRVVRSTIELEELRASLGQLRSKACTDPSSGVANRRLLESFLAIAVNEARRDGRPLSLLRVGVDRHAELVDRLGRQVGDLAIRLVARTLDQAVKRRDLVARDGGQAFTIVLPDCDLQNAMAVAEDLARRVRSSKLADEGVGRAAPATTVSIGVAELRELDMPERLCKRADRALQLARERGDERLVGERELEVLGRPKLDPTKAAARAGA